MVELPQLENWTDFQGLSVAVVGDLVADRYIYARPTRPSREAPVMVLREEGEELLPGGAANTARNARQLGAKTHLVGTVGRDEAGRGLLEHLDRNGVRLGGVHAIDGWDTPIKTRVLAGEHDRPLPLPAKTLLHLGQPLVRRPKLRQVHPLPIHH